VLPSRLKDRCNPILSKIGSRGIEEEIFGGRLKRKSTSTVRSAESSGGSLK